MGAALALFSVLRPEPVLTDSGDNAAARVNGRVISQQDVDLALEAIRRDSRNPLPDDAYTHALDRLIDEELLLQRGVAIDLPHDAAGVRQTVVLAMIDSIIAGAALPTDAELRELFETERALFEGAPRLRVRWTQAATQDGDRTSPLAAPPDRLLSLTDLRGYLGPTLSEALAGAQAGSQIGPIEAAGRIHWVDVLEREAATPADFESSRAAVAALYRARAESAALEAYLDRLRDEADIVRRDASAGE